MRKVAVSLADSVDLRVILSVLYTITEVMRAEKVSESTEYTGLVDNFSAELSKILINFKEFVFLLFVYFSANSIDEELLPVKLLGMITRFCSGSAPHFPMKKVLLLLWKISLVTLGGMETLRTLKGMLIFLLLFNC